MNVNIHAAGFKADQKLTNFINEKVGKIEQFHDKIIDVDVYLKLDTHSKVKDKIV